MMFLTKIYFPVVNTENGDFSYNQKISNESLIKLQDEQYRRTTDNIDRFLHGYQTYGKHEVFDPLKDKTVIDEINYVPFECALQGVRDDININPDFFKGFTDNGKMFILKVNINHTVMDPDAESELRFWMDDSRKLLIDRQLDDKTKLKHLPTRDIVLDVENEKYLLHRCKLIEKYKNEKFPYYFAIIVEKITKK